MIWIVLTTLMLVSVKCDEWDLVHFSESLSEIYRCLEKNHDLWNTLRVYLDVHQWRSPILEELSSVFYGETVGTAYLNETIEELVTALFVESVLRYNETIPVKRAIVNALIECSDEESNGLPHFVGERPLTVSLINLILVDFDDSLDLRTLCSYAQSAMTLLAYSRRRMRSSYDLFVRLRRMWTRRSELFFNFADEVPYIRHTYSINHSRPYTNDDPGLFTPRRRDSYNIRNPLASMEEVFRVVSFHVWDRNNHDSDIFYSLPNRLSMTESDYYYEIHENRFFRVLFFYLELVERGIVDVYSSENLLSIDLVPEDIMQILINDTTYGEYLEVRRSKELNFGHTYGSRTVQKCAKYLENNVRVNEPDLIMLFWDRLQSLAITSTTTMSTSSFSDTSSTSEFKEWKREEEQVTETSLKKYYTKNQRMFNDKDKENYDYDPGPSCTKNFKNLHQTEEAVVKYYGYVIPSKNRGDFSIEMLPDVISSVIESEMSIHRDSCD